MKNVIKLITILLNIHVIVNFQHSSPSQNIHVYLYVCITVSYYVWRDKMLAIHHHLYLFYCRMMRELTNAYAYICCIIYKCVTTFSIFEIQTLYIYFIIFYSILTVCVRIYKHIHTFLQTLIFRTKIGTEKYWTNKRMLIRKALR